MNAVSMQTLLEKLNAARAEAQQLPSRAQGTAGVSATPVFGLARPAAAPAVDFAGVLAKSLAHVDGAQKAATTMAEQFQMGAPNVTLESTMIAVQKANIEFQALVQVRNKVVAAYTDIMNMQV